MYASDTPSRPMAVDGFSLLHAAYGLLAAWILRRVLDDADVIILIIAGVAIAWEVVENSFPRFFGPFFGESDYVGDSKLNAVADVVVGVFAGIFGLIMGAPANYITGFVLLGLGVTWAVLAWRNRKLKNNNSVNG